jgi:ribosome maturation factor RimP
MNDVSRIKTVIEQKLAAMGLELVDIQFNQAGKYSSLRIFVDKPGGITVGDCENASNELSVVLDVEEFSNSHYTLEVSSPGLDRPLKTEKDFSRVLGKDIELDYHFEDKSKHMAGNLVSVENGTIGVQTENGLVSVEISRIISAKLDIGF